MFQIRKVIYFLAAGGIALCLGCNHPNHQKSMPLDSACFVRLLNFADTLKLDTSKTLNYYLSDKKIEVNGCDLKKFRHEFKMQAAIVLIILKIHNNDMKRGGTIFLAQPIESVSKSASKIIIEYAHLYYGRDIYYAESLKVNDIIAFIMKNPKFLKVPQINKEYDLTLKFNSYK